MVFLVRTREAHADAIVHKAIALEQHFGSRSRRRRRRRRTTGSSSIRRRNCAARSRMPAALQLRMRKPSMLTFALATSSTGPLGQRSRIDLSVGLRRDQTHTVRVDDGRQGCRQRDLRRTLMEIVLRPFAAAAMNSASRSEPGPRSSPLVTVDRGAVIGLARRNLARLDTRSRCATNTPSSTSTTMDSTARRLTAMIVSGRTLQNEHGVPRTFDRAPPEQHVHRCRQTGHERDRHAATAVAAMCACAAAARS